MERLVQEFKVAMADPKINHKIFKKALVETPSWDSMINYIEFAKKAGNYRSDYDGFHIFNCGDDEDISHLNGAADFLNFMGKVYDIDNPSQKRFTFFCSCSLLSKSSYKGTPFKKACLCLINSSINTSNTFKFSCFTIIIFYLLVFL
jgi:hypothetical protein